MQTFSCSLTTNQVLRIRQWVNLLVKTTKSLSRFDMEFSMVEQFWVNFRDLFVSSIAPSQLTKTWTDLTSCDSAESSTSSSRNASTVRSTTKLSSFSRSSSTRTLVVVLRRRDGNDLWNQKKQIIIRLLRSNVEYRKKKKIFNLVINPLSIIARSNSKFASNRWNCEEFNLIDGKEVKIEKLEIMPGRLCRTVGI